MRGRLLAAARRVVRHGLIPAGAGQTCTRRGGRCRPGAHPRRCGADVVGRTRRPPVLGSSPQVRGRRHGICFPLIVTGLIPAGAGQTWWAGRGGHQCWAHPRRCGADMQAGGEHHRAQGSSPQVRGRHQRGSPRHRRSVAHPRRCGADEELENNAADLLGSSPPVRGRPGPRLLKGITAGLIPAGAGQTSGGRAAGAQRGAHPRRCGADLAPVY